MCTAEKACWESLGADWFTGSKVLEARVRGCTEAAVAAPQVWRVGARRGSLCADAQQVVTAAEAASLQAALRWGKALAKFHMGCWRGNRHFRTRFGA